MDGFGGPCEAAAVHAHVVVHRDPGEWGDIFAAQPGHVAVAAVGGQPGLLRGQPRAAGSQELPDFAAQFP